MPAVSASVAWRNWEQPASSRARDCNKISRTCCVLTPLVSVVRLGTGRTTVLQGAVHLVILAAFLYLAIVP